MKLLKHPPIAEGIFKNKSVLYSIKEV